MRKFGLGLILLLNASAVHANVMWMWEASDGAASPMTASGVVTTSGSFADTQGVNNSFTVLEINSFVFDGVDYTNSPQWAAGAILPFELSGNSPNDEIVVTAPGQAIIDSTLTETLTFQSGANRIRLSNAPGTINFTNFDDLDGSFTTNTLTFTVIAVPEPSAFWLVASIGVVAARRRRQFHHHRRQL